MRTVTNEHSSEPLRPTKVGKFLDYLCDYQFLKKNFIPKIFLAGFSIHKPITHAKLQRMLL